MCQGNKVLISKSKGGQKKEWEFQHEMADERSSIMRVSFESAVNSLRDEIDLDDLEKTVVTGKTAKITQKIKFTQESLKALDEQIDTGIDQSAQSSERFLPTVRPDSIYNKNSQAKKDWIEFYSKQRLQQMDRQTKKIVTQTLKRKVNENLPPREVAKILRESIGMNSVQAKAMENLESSMRKKGKSEKQIEKAKEQYRNRAIKYRARMIADTEAVDAVNFGQLELWQQAREEQLIDPEVMVKEWVVTPSDKLCDHCKAMDGQQKHLDDLFVDPTGTFRPVYAPTLHPSCRCSMILTRKKEGKK